MSVDLLKLYADNYYMAVLHHPPVTAEEPPTVDGVYVVEVYFGWKILQWHKGEWWHTDLVGRWTASTPVQWVGPLPERQGTKRVENPAPQVFDL
jgi:hypothetical protein